MSQQTTPSAAAMRAAERITPYRLSREHLAAIIDTEIQAAIRETAERCAQIAERHKQEWIRPSDGAERVVVAAHACHLVMDKIRREFGLEEK